MDDKKRKLRIYFPEVEAGFGHIMTCRAVREVFEQKYGDQFDIITDDFYKSSDNKTLRKYGDMLVKSVQDYTSHARYGIFAGVCCEMFGQMSTWSTMNVPVPGSVKQGIKHMMEHNADVVYSTHWATNYYIMKMKKPRPFSIMYCPDAVLNQLFKMKSDLTLCSMMNGYKNAKRDPFYNSKNLKLVPFCLRNESFNISTDRKMLRNKLNLKEDSFVLVLAEGGYGNGQMPNIVRYLLEKNLPMTIVAIAGKNEKLFNEMKNYKVGDKTTYIPMGFCNNILEYLACADLFCGKAGNMISEPTFFGTPSLISSVTSLIEINIAHHYCDYLKCAIYEKNPKKAANIIEGFVKDPTLLLPYKENAVKHHDYFGAEPVADILYEEIMKRFGYNI